MPIYVYKHPEKEEYEEVLQGMSEEHAYSKDGVEWERVFLPPNASVSTSLDPFNRGSFIEKTGSMKGTVGDMLSLSEELSEKRAAQSKDGKDPVKEEFYKKYSKERKGARHPDELKKFGNSRVDVDYEN